jgi:hypothetical protein
MRKRAVVVTSIVELWAALSDTAMNVPVVRTPIRR